MNFDAPDRRTPPVLVELMGEVDLAAVPELADRLARAVAAGPDVLVDLTDCEFLDTQVVGELVRAKEQLRRSQRHMVVVTDPSSLASFVMGLVAPGAFTTFPTRQLGEIAVQLTSRGDGDVG